MQQAAKFGVAFLGELTGSGFLARISNPDVQAEEGDERIGILETAALEHGGQGHRIERADALDLFAAADLIPPAGLSAAGLQMFLDSPLQLLELSVQLLGQVLRFRNVTKALIQRNTRLNDGCATM
ncbi:hypothetical protein BAY1663_05099 [Pseudomonas sp. BAY1663]|nr:hypothetical protein BAY1663_05099 [Pseudomonas sp. BAY1663]